jgi:hypothetical protein
VYVPLDDVRREWLDARGRGTTQLKHLGHHSGIYKDVFGKEFHPQGYLWAEYPESHLVTWGDIIAAKYAVSQPKVTLPGNMDGTYATLILTNPDGHLGDNTQEVLHWMV